MKLSVDRKVAAGSVGVSNATNWARSLPSPRATTVLVVPKSIPRARGMLMRVRGILRSVLGAKTRLSPRRPSVSGL